VDVDESQEANVKGNQAAERCAEDTSPGELSKEPYMDDVCKLSVRGLVTEDLCHSEDSERGRELDHMATDQQSMRLISSLLLLHQHCCDAADQCRRGREISLTPGQQEQMGRMGSKV
jgi:hypothetical protein